MSEKTAGTSAALRFKIRGMDCAEEVATLRREVGPIVGGESNLAFDVVNGRMTVMTSGNDLPVVSIVRAVERAEVWRDAPELVGAGRGRLRDGRTM